MSAESKPQSPINRHINYGQQQDKFANVGRCHSTGKEVTICYNDFGDPKNPCLLLTQGIGTSLLGFSLDFVNEFVSRGFYVIRYDNRDIGRSTRFDEYPAPSLVRYVIPEWASIGERLPYTLKDVMEDGMGLLTALGIKKAHVFGLSMGGMIAQLMAIHYPERVLSLNILFSHMGGSDAIEPGLFTHVRFLKTPRSSSVADRVDHMVWYIEFLSQGQYRNNYDELREYIALGYERDGMNNELGQPRQITALMRARSRREQLKKVTCPTLVMHGALDPLIPVENGYALAETIPGAKLVIFPTLGHDFPPQLYGDFAAEMALNMRKASPA